MKAAALCVAVLQSACAEPLALTPNQTVLVVAKSAPGDEQDAAKLLQTWLRKASGSATGYGIENDRSLAELNGRTAITIGQTPLLPPDPRLAKLEDDGFIIRHEGQVIAIEGKTNAATYYGAVSFLDRYAGVRFYMPGELWTSVPANHEVDFDGGDVVSQPFVTSASMSGISTKNFGDADWLRKIAGNRLKGGTHQHNLGAIFPPEKYAAKYPEIYPIYNGQRYIPKTAGDQSWQADFTAPETLTAAEESITDYFKVTSGAAYIAVSINDNTRWSESEANEKVLEEFKAKDPKGDYKTEADSDIYWRFMNQLAAWTKEKFPDKYLVGLAYGVTSAAPPFKLEDNIVAFTVFHIGELYIYDTAWGGHSAYLSQWLAVTSHYGNHDWYQGEGYLFPRIYSDNWSKFMKELASHMTFAYMHAEAYPNWGFDGPKLYIMAKLWWDPQVDENTLTRQFCDDMFGPAAEPMDDYFSELETLWKQLNQVEGPKRKIAYWGTQFGTTPASRAMIERCHDLLLQAAAAAQTDEQKQRVALFAKCFAFSESLFALAEKPKDEALYNHAVELAMELVKDKWTVYNPAEPMEAIKAIYKGPAPK